MLRTPLFIWIFITIVVIAILHFSAFQFYLYWRFWWFDVLTHFLGGLWIAISFLWLFFQSGFVNVAKNNKNYSLAVALLSSFIIGIMWEIFEYYFGIAVTDASNYTIDTVTDISLDVVGGIIAYCFFVFKKYHKYSIKDQISSNS